MIAKLGKRFISFLLVMLMVVSMFPMQVFASEVDTDTAEHECEECVDHDHDESTDSTTETTQTTTTTTTAATTTSTASESTTTAVTTTTTAAQVEKTALQELQDAVDEFNAAYFDGNGSMSEEEVTNAVIAMDGDTLYASMDAYYAIVDAAEANEITEDDIASLQNFETLCWYSGIISKMMSPMLLASATCYVCSNQIYVYDESGTVTASGDNAITATATSSSWSSASNTVYLTNNTSNSGELSFNYAFTGIGSADYGYIGSNKVANASNASGTYTIELEAGASMYVKVGGWGTSASTYTVKLTNITFTPILETSNVTFDFDSSLCSVTVDGTAVASGDTQAITKENGAVLAATASSGATFLGWIDGDNKIVSTEASFTLNPITDMTVTPVFVTSSSKAWFGVGTATSSDFAYKISLITVTSGTYYNITPAYMFDDLTEAANYASSTTNKYMCL